MRSEMIILKHKFIKIFIWMLFLCNYLSAQDMERTALRDRPSLSIIVHQIQPSVSSSFDIDIVFTNVTNKAFDVADVKILLPESIEAIRANLGNWKNFEVETHEVRPGSERIYRMHIPGVNSSVFDLESLFFVPGNYVIRSEIIFKESGKEISQSMYSTYEIELEPPLSAVLRGGVIGALLLAVFVPAYRILHKRKDEKIKIRDLLGQAVTFFLSGSVVSITAILLLQRLGNLALPISITVNDFLGGIVVGLFSYSIGNALYKQFFKTTS